MKYFLQLILAGVAFALVHGLAAAPLDFSGDRRGVGLKLPRGAAAPTAIADIGSEAWRARYLRLGSEYSLHAGTEPVSGLRLRPAQPYSSIYYAFSDTWGSSLEAGTTPGSLLSPRRYSVQGQVYTTLTDGRGLTLGLGFRVYDTGGEAAGPLAGSYGIHAWRAPGAALPQSYQLHLSYQHSPATSFGLVLGRDLETFTPAFEAPPNGLKQLTFTGQHWLTPSWALSYDVLSGDPGSTLRVQGLRLGVRYRF